MNYRTMIYAECLMTIAVSFTVMLKR